MSDRIARLGVLLGSMFLLAGIFVTVLLMFILNRWPFQTNSSLATTTAMMMIITIWTWRRYVRWTLLRRLSTASICGLVLAQSLIMGPLFWGSGCASDFFLLVGQTELCNGMWCFLCGLIWWNAQLIGHGASGQTRMNEGGHRMSQGVARIAVGLGLVPLLIGVFIQSGTLMQIGLRMSDGSTLAASGELSAIIAIGIWLGLWSGRVSWTRRRMAITVALAVSLLASPIGILLVEPGSTRGWGSVAWTAMCVLPFFGLAAWFAGTSWIWRTSRGAAPDSPDDSSTLAVAMQCATCGYSLKGLTTIRCPECGWSTTVDDLLQRTLTQLSDA